MLTNIDRLCEEEGNKNYSTDVQQLVKAGIAVLLYWE